MVRKRKIEESINILKKKYNRLRRKRKTEESINILKKKYNFLKLSYAQLTSTCKAINPEKESITTEGQKGRSMPNWLHSQILVFRKFKDSVWRRSKKGIRVCTQSIKVLQVLTLKVQMWKYAFGGMFLIVSISTLLERREQAQWFVYFLQSKLPGVHTSYQESDWDSFEKISLRDFNRLSLVNRVEVDKNKSSLDLYCNLDKQCQKKCIDLVDSPKEKKKQELLLPRMYYRNDVSSWFIDRDGSESILKKIIFPVVHTPQLNDAVGAKLRFSKSTQKAEIESDSIPSKISSAQILFGSAQKERETEFLSFCFPKNPSVRTELTTLPQKNFTLCLDAAQPGEQKEIQENQASDFLSKPHRKIVKAIESEALGVQASPVKATRDVHHISFLTHVPRTKQDSLRERLLTEFNAKGNGLQSEIENSSQTLFYKAGVIPSSFPSLIVDHEKGSTNFKFTDATILNGKKEEEENVSPLIEELEGAEFLNSLNRCSLLVEHAVDTECDRLEKSSSLSTKDGNADSLSSDPEDKPITKSGLKKALSSAQSDSAQQSKHNKDVQTNQASKHALNRNQKFEEHSRPLKRKKLENRMKLRFFTKNWLPNFGFLSPTQRNIYSSSIPSDKQASLFECVMKTRERKACNNFPPKVRKKQHLAQRSCRPCKLRLHAKGKAGHGHPSSALSCSLSPKAKSKKGITNEKSYKLFLVDRRRINSWLIINQLILTLSIKTLSQSFSRVLGPLLLKSLKTSIFGAALLPKLVSKSSDIIELYTLRKRDQSGISFTQNGEDTVSACSEIVWYLRNSCRGRTQPRGIILVGQKSSENTALLKGIISSAHVPVIVQSLQAFTSNRGHPQFLLERLLQHAQKNAPCVLFLDDLDAIGGSRNDLIGRPREVAAKTDTSLLTNLACTSSLFTLEREHVPFPCLNNLRKSFDRKRKNEKHDFGYRGKAGTHTVFLKSRTDLSQRSWERTAIKLGGQLSFFAHLRKQGTLKAFGSYAAKSWQGARTSSSLFLESCCPCKRSLQGRRPTKRSLQGQHTENKGYTLAPPTRDAVSLSYKQSLFPITREQPVSWPTEHLCTTLSLAKKGNTCTKPSFNVPYTSTNSTISTEGSQGFSQGKEVKTSNDQIKKLMEERRIDLMLRLLTVMDGVSRLQRVLVVTTTQNSSLLDSALLRPGRFEKFISVKLPDKSRRIELFKVETSKIGYSTLMPWEYLSGRTAALTSTDITSAVNHSALRAILENTGHTVATLECGLDYVNRVQLLNQRSSSPLSDPSKQDKENTSVMRSGSMKF